MAGTVTFLRRRHVGSDQKDGGAGLHTARGERTRQRAVLAHQWALLSTAVPSSPSALEIPSS